MATLSVNAPAKINLSLRVKGKRVDGFHELETVMLPLPELYDTLVFTEANTFKFTCDKPDVPTDESNLVVKAVRLFEKCAKLKVSYEILLEKRVPHGAGLGGGSSDAATTLLTLNKLYESKLSLEELHDIAAEIGSDVPFFLYESACICRGRGDLIETLPQVDPFALCLFKPDFGVPTADAYQRWEESKELPGIPYRSQKGPLGEMKNDLERPVFEKFLFLAECKRWLLMQPEVKVAQMSGSGSTMIAVVDDVSDCSLHNSVYCNNLTLKCVILA